LHIALGVLFSGLKKKDLTPGGILGSIVTSAKWKLSQKAAPNEQLSSSDDDFLYGGPRSIPLPIIKNSKM
jgi:hypothetical protein